MQQPSLIAKIKGSSKRLIKRLIVLCLPDIAFDVIARIDPNRHIRNDKFPTQSDHLRKRLEVVGHNKAQLSAGFKAKLHEQKLRTDSLRDMKERFREELKDARTELNAIKKSGLLLPGQDLRAAEYPVPEKAPVYAKFRMKILLLNSMGGSMGRYASALQLHENIHADCVIASFAPRSSMFAPHETNVYGVYNNDEWINYLKTCFKKYDFIQSSTFPIHQGVADCYDWINECIGIRHIWRATGFVHHYVKREDVLPSEEYDKFMVKAKQPGAHNYFIKSYPIEGDRINVKDNTVVYSSPEKGAYLKGDFVRWLPGIREPDAFENISRKPSNSDTPYIYVPYHRNAVWKGLEFVIHELNELLEEGEKFHLVTSENAGEFFPDLATDSSSRKGAYPILPHNIPRLLARMDAVIDQILMGSYGNTGLEAMLTGLPVVGQKRYDDIAHAPIWEVDMTNFKERFREFLHSRDQWETLGAAGKEYALSHHSPAAVAARGRTIYEELNARVQGNGI